MQVQGLMFVVIICVITEDSVSASSLSRQRRTFEPFRRRLRGWVERAANGQLDGAIKNATEKVIKNFFSGKEGLLIAPGTKWCGAGNVAQDFEDLGEKFEADVCCRDHDNCFDNIGAHKNKHGLMNENPYTMSHCECEREFYRCLKAGDTIGTAAIGFTYFNILRPKCFTFEYPIIDCVRFGQRHPKTEDCQEYIFDFSLPKRWQTMDALDWRDDL